MSMSLNMASTTFVAAAATPSAGPVAEEEEYYSSWSLFLVCMLLILSLLTSYYLQIKRIRAVHETFVSIVAGMFVGLIIRLAPGTMIREMLVSCIFPMVETVPGLSLSKHDSVITHGMWMRVFFCGRTEHEADHPARLLNILSSSISCFRLSSWIPDMNLNRCVRLHTLPLGLFANQKLGKFL